MDSTSETKFSAHLIYSKIAFQTNCQISSFVNKLIKSFNAQEKDCFQCQVGGVESVFIDTNVYDRNRNLRIYLSSKLGRKSQFVQSHMLGVNVNEDPKQLFKESIIQNITSEAKIIEEKLICVVDESRRLSNVEGRSKVAMPCPYSEIEAIIQENIKEPGRIDNCSFYPATDIYLFNVRGSRFCPNVQREHRSNRVYFTFNCGTMLLEQKCHSLNCRGFSKILEIPAAKLDWLTNMEKWEED